MAARIATMVHRSDDEAGIRGPASTQWVRTGPSAVGASVQGGLSADVVLTYCLADCEGLVAVVRRSRYINGRLKKRLVQLDFAFAYLSQVTDTRIGKLMEALLALLGESSVGTGPPDVADGSHGSDHVEATAEAARASGARLAAALASSRALSHTDDLSSRDGERVEEAVRSRVSMASHAIFWAVVGGSCSVDGTQGAGTTRSIFGTGVGEDGNDPGLWHHGGLRRAG